MNSSLQTLPLQRIDGSQTTLGAFGGKVLLVVNVASKCGLTPQYTGLELLYQDKRAAGLEILGFPANNFKQQEPGSEAEIASFCSVNYDVHFPLFAKLSVLGPDQHPLYTALTAACPHAEGDGPFRDRLKGHGMTPSNDPDVLWNFEKFIIDRNGEVVGRFAPDVTADDARLVALIDAELAKSPA